MTLPKKSPPTHRQLTFYPDLDQYNRFKALCKDRGVSGSHILRCLLRQWLASAEKTAVKP